MGVNRVALGVVLQYKNTKAIDWSSLVDELNQAFTSEFSYGTGPNQVDQLFGLDTRTLAGGASESLDLIGGGLLDNHGNAIAMVKVRAIFIINLSSTKILTVGNDANPLNFMGTVTHEEVLAPGGKFAKDNPITGWTVTPGTGDKIKVANNAGDPADYAVLVAGTSA